MNHPNWLPNGSKGFREFQFKGLFRVSVMEVGKVLRILYSDDGWFFLLANIVGFFVILVKIKSMYASLYFLIIPLP